MERTGVLGEGQRNHTHLKLMIRPPGCHCVQEGAEVIAHVVREDEEAIVLLISHMRQRGTSYTINELRKSV